jgi:hypothetical protein
MKQPLEKEGFHYNDNAKALWVESEPFVENARGILIHRPRTVTTRRGHVRGNSYISIHFYCGQVTCGDKNLTFLSSPPDGRLVCHACEMRALMLKLPSSSELAGKHVCTGKLKAFNSCAVHGEHP